MKHLIIASLATLLVLSTACSKKPDAEAITPESETAAPATDAAKTTDAAPAADAAATSAATGSGGLSLQQIAESLSKSVCERMGACDKSAGLTVADCAAGMTSDLAQALPAKAGDTTKAQLDTCLGAIAKATCEELNSPNPPKGCEFIE